MLKILRPESPRDTEHLAQMHQLRYVKFIKELGWKDGIQKFSQMEFDCFDHDNTFYLTHIDQYNKVDAVARLTQTCHPNLLFDVFQDNIQFISPERSTDVIEISRFCADQKRAPRNVMAQIIAGLLEIGTTYNIKYYVSFSNCNIKPRAERCGWSAQEMGDVIQIGLETAVALRHEVSKLYHNKVHVKNGFQENLLSKEEILRCPSMMFQTAI